MPTKNTTQIHLTIPDIKTKQEPTAGFETLAEGHGLGFRATQKEAAIMTTPHFALERLSALFRCAFACNSMQTLADLELSVSKAVLRDHRVSVSG